jgi:hypothetical protein
MSFKEELLYSVHMLRTSNLAIFLQVYFKIEEPIHEPTQIGRCLTAKQAVKAHQLEPLPLGIWITLELGPSQNFQRSPTSLLVHPDPAKT